MRLHRETTWRWKSRQKKRPSTFTLTSQKKNPQITKDGPCAMKTMDGALSATKCSFKMTQLKWKPASKSKSSITHALFAKSKQPSRNETRKLSGLGNYTKTQRMRRSSWSRARISTLLLSSQLLSRSSSKTCTITPSTMISTSKWTHSSLTSRLTTWSSGVMTWTTTSTWTTGRRSQLQIRPRYYPRTATSRYTKGSLAKSA